MTADWIQVLLAWFDREKRDLPWRDPVKAPPGLRRDPYGVVVSEFMLQQTQVAAVIPYYQRFMETWPNFTALAGASEDLVLKAWEGLGYYRRARNLLALARQVVQEHGGRLPSGRKQLLGLPGIGPYTAGAVRAFAFNLPQPAVDGNVVRVFARLDAMPHVQGDPKAFRTVSSQLEDLFPQGRAGDFAEALMELGAVCCLPAGPDCGACPLSAACLAFLSGTVLDYPVKARAPERPVSHLTYLLIHDGRSVFVSKRPQGLLEGLYEFICLEGRVGQGEEGRIRKAVEEWTGRAQMQADFKGFKRTVFSHRIWDMAFWEIRTRELELPLVFQDKGGEGPELIRVDIEEVGQMPFPAFLAGWRDTFLEEQGGQ